MGVRTFGAAAALAAATALVAGAAAAETLRLAHHHAVGGSVDLTANRLAELVEERSGGSLTIDVFPAAQLGQEVEAFDLLNQGVIDMTITSLGHMDRYFPPMAVTSLPFIFRDWDHADRAFEGEFGQALTEGMLETSESRLLAYLYLGFRDMLFADDPATSVAEMDGLRMRSPESFMWIRMFELVGARPTPVTWGEVYTAMQTGIAAGLESPPMAALDMKFNEVTSALVETKHMFGSMAIVINEPRFQGLSAEHQALLQAAAIEAADWSNDEVSRPGEEQALQQMRDLGMQVLEPEDPEAWAAAMRPLWEEVAAERPGSDAFIEMLEAAQ